MALNACSALELAIAVGGIGAAYYGFVVDSWRNVHRAVDEAVDSYVQPSTYNRADGLLESIRVDSVTYAESMSAALGGDAEVVSLEGTIPATRTTTVTTTVTAAMLEKDTTSCTLEFEAEETPAKESSQGLAPESANHFHAPITQEASSNIPPADTLPDTAADFAITWLLLCVLIALLYCIYIRLEKVGQRTSNEAWMTNMVTLVNVINENINTGMSQNIRGLVEDMGLTLEQALGRHEEKVAAKQESTVPKLTALDLEPLLQMIRNLESQQKENNRDIASVKRESTAVHERIEAQGRRLETEVQEQGQNLAWRISAHEQQLKEEGNSLRGEIPKYEPFDSAPLQSQLDTLRDQRMEDLVAMDTLRNEIMSKANADLVSELQEYLIAQEEEIVYLKKENESKDLKLQALEQHIERSINSHVERFTTKVDDVFKRSEIELSKMWRLNKSSNGSYDQHIRSVKAHLNSMNEDFARKSALFSKVEGDVRMIQNVLVNRGFLQQAPPAPQYPYNQTSSYGTNGYRQQAGAPHASTDDYDFDDDKTVSCHYEEEPDEPAHRAYEANGSNAGYKERADAWLDSQGIGSTNGSSSAQQDLQVWSSPVAQQRPTQSSVTGGEQPNESPFRFGVDDFEFSPANTTRDSARTKKPSSEQVSTEPKTTTPSFGLSSTHNNDAKAKQSVPRASPALEEPASFGASTQPSFNFGSTFTPPSQSSFNFSTSGPSFFSKKPATSAKADTTHTSDTARSQQTATPQDLPHVGQPSQSSEPNDSIFSGLKFGQTDFDFNFGKASPQEGQPSTQQIFSFGWPQSSNEDTSAHQQAQKASASDQQEVDLPDYESDE